MKNRFFGALWVIAFVLLFALLMSNLTGCEYVPEAQRVSHNISRQAEAGTAESEETGGEG